MPDGSLHLDYDAASALSRVRYSVDGPTFGHEDAFSYAVWFNADSIPTGTGNHRLLQFLGNNVVDLYFFGSDHATRAMQLDFWLATSGRQVNYITKADWLAATGETWDGMAASWWRLIFTFENGGNATLWAAKPNGTPVAVMTVAVSEDLDTVASGRQTWQAPSAGMQFQITDDGTWNGVLGSSSRTSLAANRIPDATVGDATLISQHVLTNATATAVNASDTGLDDTETPGIGDYDTNVANASWIADDPLASATGDIQIDVYTELDISNAASLRLPNMRTNEGGTDNTIRFRITNAGAADLEVTSVTADGHLTIIGDPSTTLASTESTWAVVQIDSASAGSKTGTVTIESDDGTDGTFEFDLTTYVSARETSVPTITPDGDWDGTPGSGFDTAPSASATENGSGFAYQVSGGLCSAIDGAAFPSSTIRISCHFDHGDLGGLEYVDIWCENDTAKRLYLPVWDDVGDTSRQGGCMFAVDIDGSAMVSAGDARANVYIRAKPYNGYELFLGPIEICFEHDWADSGTIHQVNDSSELATALAAWGAGDVIEFTTAGTYNYASTSAVVANGSGKPCVMRLGAGLAKGDVILQNGTADPNRGPLRLRVEKLTLQGLHLEMSLTTEWYGYDRTFFYNTDIKDANGAAGPDDGYYDPGGANIRWTVGEGQTNGFNGGDIVLSNPVTFQALYNYDMVHSIDSANLFNDCHHACGTIRTAGTSDLLPGGAAIVRERNHTGTTIEVSAVGAFSGGKTTITFAGEGGTMSDHTNTVGASSEDYHLWVRSGSQAGAIFVYDVVDATAETVSVHGDATGLSAGDTVTVFLTKHQDWCQNWEIDPGNDTENQSISNLRCLDKDAQVVQPILTQVVDATAKTKRLSIFNCSMNRGDYATANENQGQFQGRHEHVIIRHLSVQGSHFTARDDLSNWEATAFTITDSVMGQGLETASGIVTTNSHADTEHGANLTGVGDTNGTIDWDGDLKPTASDVAIANRYPLVSRGMYDLNGNLVPIDGTGAIGAVQWTSALGARRGLRGRARRLRRRQTLATLSE